MKLIKNKKQNSLIHGALLVSRSTFALTAAILAAGAVQKAGAQAAKEETVGEMAMSEELEESTDRFVSGTITTAVNTHFISYGFDVWGTGGRWNNLSFNPMIDFNFDIGKGFTANGGVWADVNNNAVSSIGASSAVQEIDVWLGVSYGYEKWSFTLLYQNWMYGGQNERIVDGIVGYDHWLSPSLTIHTRVDNGFSSDLNGVVGVLGVAPGKEFGMVSLSFPVNVAFSSEDFHDYSGVGTDAGLTFINAGVGASIPLEFMPGEWTADAGLTFWYTPSDTIAVNPEEAFLTGSIGVSLAF